MNRIHRVVFNRSTGVMQVVSEVASAGGGAQTATTRATAPAAPRLSRLAAACAAAVSAGVLMLGTPAMAQVFNGPVQTWDADTATAGIQGGSGTWQSIIGNSNWITDGSTTNTPFQLGASAIFTGAGGNVAVDTAIFPIIVQSVRFDGDGYVLGGGTLQANSGVTAVG
ncbi:MAG: hypothetical protein EOO54_26925, partial [Haliea sp.]